MIIHDCVQGTPEWAWLRAGIPTASNFDKILTPGGKKGEPAPSKSAPGYMFKLLAERIMQHPCQEFMSHWMDRGSQMEAEAVSFYELQRDCDTTKIGFITNDTETIGASPDRLVDTNGLLEIKVPSEGIHVGYLLQAGSAYEEYRVQVQGQLWIANREWTDVLSWHPEMPPALIRIERDEKFIRLLSAAVEAFSVELERMSEELQARGWMNRPKPKAHVTTASELMKEALRGMKEVSA